MYNYQEINTSINDTEIDAVEVDFSVNKSWVDDNNRTKEDVVMKRFNDQSWETLDTRYLNETEDEYNLEASSTGFSFYAVALQEEQTDGETTDQQDDQNNQNEQKNDQQTQESDGPGPILPVAAVVLFLIAGGLYYARTKEMI